MTQKTSLTAPRARAPQPPAEGSPHAVPPMRLSYLIGQLDRVVSRRLTEALARHGLTLPQYTALSVLRARGRSSNAQLAERSFITPQAANEVVKTMEANGWVMREADPMNRRVVLLSLTKAGNALLGECDAAADHVEGAMLDDMDTETAEKLHALLHACVRNLRAA
ncbi:MarR family transcriptional regulator [Paraburkholderia sp. CNPSo 3272]|uniref:MarR family winged helix-turn-helix transcriptional regulator n=1 Tax=Paraburkholderia sp. CNPSo 3272 TaxID=2940931 RepID=UPI0020B7A980|nr:MarR family transcriptional regulator [Paraburkholderia sp. CNPSo 3272]MCP3726101.1 MarR family transcriptional regulator [Paraburkholderia sp. CNPSo 3272]